MAKYQLFAMPFDEQSIKAVRNERFQRITKEYVLVYTASDTLAREHHIIDDGELSYLSDDDRQWLMDCNIQVIIEESSTKTEEILKSFEEKLNLLETELEKESKANGSTSP